MYAACVHRCVYYLIKYWGECNAKKFEQINIADSYLSILRNTYTTSIDSLFPSTWRCAMACGVLNTKGYYV